MKLHIIGDTNDDKGKQLEELTEAILKECGYEYVSLNTVVAGGSEIDVKAKRVYELAGIQKEIPVICECKAKNDTITINDWLKFVGKVSIARMNNAQTEGVMIALSGANGNVVGSYDALPDKSFLHLITHDSLIKLVCKHYHLRGAEDVRSCFENKTDRTIDGIDLVYYDKQVWWVIRFIHEEYAVVSDKMTAIEDKYLDEFLERLGNYTAFKKTGYVDVQKEEAARVMADLIKKSVVFLLMKNGSMALSDVFEEKQKFDYLKPFGNTEIEEQVGKCPYIKRDGDKLVMKDASEIDIVDFYKWYGKAPMVIDGIATEYYVTNIDEKLLDTVIKIQENLEIPEERKDDCLYIMTLSPGALTYALTPDEVIVNSRKMGGGTIPTVNKFHSDYFMNQLAACLQKDLQDARFATFYCRKFGLNDYSIETEILLRFVEQKFNRKINYNSYVSFMNANGQTVPVLLFEKPKELKQRDDDAG